MPAGQNVLRPPGAQELALKAQPSFRRNVPDADAGFLPATRQSVSQRLQDQIGTMALNEIVRSVLQGKGGAADSAAKRASQNTVT